MYVYVYGTLQVCLCVACVRVCVCSSPQGHRHEVTITNYEAAPNPADHKTEQIQPVGSFVSWASHKVSS